MGNRVRPASSPKQPTPGAHRSVPLPVFLQSASAREFVDSYLRQFSAAPLPALLRPIPQRQRVQRRSGQRWLNEQRAYLRRFPLCVTCLRQGALRPAQHVDHILDLEYGGTYAEDNLQPLCARCNEDKRIAHRGYRNLKQLQEQRIAQWEGRPVCSLGHSCPTPAPCSRSQSCLAKRLPAMAQGS